MGTTEGLTFVTPSLAFGDGDPHSRHIKLSDGRAVPAALAYGDAPMVVVPDEEQARIALRGLGLTESLIDDRIRFGQTGEVTVTG